MLGLFSYGISVLSGLFIPVISAGATYGRSVGMFMDPFTNLDQGLFAVLGAASFLGGSTRMTVSLCVILLELTNNLYMLSLIMLVLLISKSVADIFNSGVYYQIVHMKGFTYLEAHAEPYIRHLTAGDVITVAQLTRAWVRRLQFNYVGIMQNSLFDILVCRREYVLDSITYVFCLILELEAEHRIFL